ncbi:MAG: MBL fold metallo-hydrolase [Bacteroidales bacterium]|nr:MBL fold metallo-hydrolase [Bacteroidales bacterium]
MKIARFIFNSFSENTYVLWDEETKEAAIVDPGMACEDDVAKIDDFLSDNGLTLKKVLLTHQHLDHVLGVGWILERYSCKVYGHEGDIPWGEKLGMQANMFSLPYDVKPFKLSDKVVNGDTIMLGSEKIRVMHTPGHSRGGVVYYVPKPGFALVGDTIFERSIGRTDLGGGDYKTLIDSIRTKVLTLPDDTILYPGHGTSTFVEEERDYNPFLNPFM